MSTPQGPSESETKNVIDKLAAFVAKNGKEFEKITKCKQANNPKFSFLNIGDPFFSYYQYRVTTEQIALKKEQASHGFNTAPNQPPWSRPQGAWGAQTGPPPGWAPPGGHRAPAPLPGRPPGLMDREMPRPPGQWPNRETQRECQQGRLAFAVNPAIAEHERAIASSEANLLGQRDLLWKQTQAECWPATLKAETERVHAMALTVKVDMADMENTLEALSDGCSKEAISTCRQWVMSHCASTRQQEVVLLAMRDDFLRAACTDARRLHLLYLINDWAAYVHRKGHADTLELLGEYVSQLYAIAAHRTHDQPTAHDKLGKLLLVWTKAAYFSATVYAKLDDPTTTYGTTEQAVYSMNPTATAAIRETHETKFDEYHRMHVEYVAHMMQEIERCGGLSPRPVTRLPFDPSQPVTVAQPPGAASAPRRSRFDQPSAVVDYTRLPPNATFTEADLKPTVMYYDLPAGLMVPLVKSGATPYAVLEPSDLRLPAPTPPTERLLAAVDAFYAPCRPDAPRDADGWERDGLAEWYKSRSRRRSTSSTSGSASPVEQKPKLDADDAKAHVRSRKSKWDS